MVLLFFFFGELPAAVFTGIEFSTLVRLRVRGLSSRALLLLGAALGAGCCLLITAVLGGTRTPRSWALAAALNGAMWGLLVAHYASRRVAGR
jgi:hypothetical protein